MMTLQYGQCGNQIGQVLFSNIYNDLVGNEKEPYYYTQSLNQWFNISKSGKWIPRSILIDTESKTDPLMGDNSNFTSGYNLTKALGGSGNNFACGYNEYGKMLAKTVIGIIRKELEISDYPFGFLNIFSSSGGTGSGVGSLLTEVLKSNFPKNSIVNVFVMPFFTGEVPVQSYNTLLAFAKIAAVSDAIIYFENDRLHYVVSNLLDIKEVSFKDMNSLLVQQLLGLYQPIKNETTEDILSRLTPKSVMQCLQIKSAPYSGLSPAQNWKSQLTLMSKQSRFDILYKIKYKVDVNVKTRVMNMALISRGDFSPTQSDLKQFNDSNSYVFSKENVNVYHQPTKFLKVTNHLTLVTNTNSVCQPLSIFLTDALNLFNYGVYLHHYERYGFDKSNFRDSFEMVQSVVENYKKL